MNRTLRSIVLVPLAATLLVVIPSLLLSFAGRAPVATGQTVPGGTVPGGTVPSRPGSTVPAPSSDLRVRANGLLLDKVIGDRLSATIYGYTQNPRLVRSDDNGVSWDVVTTSPDVDSFLMSADNPDILYAGGPLSCDTPARDAQPFARSDDGGVTFVETESAPAGESILAPLVIHPEKPLTVIAGGCEALYESSDGGDSWQTLSRFGIDGIPSGFVVHEIFSAYAATDAEAPSLVNLHAVAVNDDGVGIVVSSSDEGRTWSVVTPELDEMAFRIRSLTGDPEDADLIWFAASGGVWSTEDLGEFWSLSSRGIPAGTVLNDLVLHPNHVLYLGTEAGLYARGTAAGRWSKLGDEAFEDLAIDSILFNESRLRRLWLNAEDGVYVYTLNWAQQ